jgi:hypothetical protein
MTSCNAFSRIRRRSSATSSLPGSCFALMALNFTSTTFPSFEVLFRIDRCSATRAVANSLGQTAEAAITV